MALLVIIIQQYNYKLFKAIWRIEKQCWDDISMESLFYQSFEMNFDEIITKNGLNYFAIKQIELCWESMYLWNNSSWFLLPIQFQLVINLVLFNNNNFIFTAKLQTFSHLFI